MHAVPAQRRMVAAFQRAEGSPEGGRREPEHLSPRLGIRTAEGLPHHLLRHAVREAMGPAGQAPDGHWREHASELARRCEGIQVVRHEGDGELLVKCEPYRKTT